MIRTTEREPAAAKDGMVELQERPARGFSKGGPARAGEAGAERSSGPASQTSAAKRGETIPFPKPYQGRRPADIAESDSPDPLEIPEPPEPPDPFDDTSYRWLHDRSGHRQDGPSWMRVFITVVGAIATGGLFGYLLLTLFTGEPLLPTQGAQSGQGTVAANGEVPVLAAPATEADGSGASASAAGAQGTAQAETPTTGEVVPSVSLYVLQHGVFRSEESMNEAAEKLRAQGIAAATDASDGYRVYAGISPTKSEADELVSLLAGTEVYVKALSSDSFQIAGVEDVDEYIGFLDASAKLYGKIAGFASATLTGQTPSTDNDLTSIRTAHQVWLEKTGPAASWIETARTYSQTEIEQLNAAVSLLNSYGESPEDELLWKAQTATMNAVFADRQLRSFIELQAGG
ncbi:SPOR domain-containing protein [Cohnella fermenti]|uniref:SPOR domain-containing protein n=2 Tax=Cohnella fermenti TaxID=2565925 RepID=A0A4V3WGD4_9BACL|nr:SPOR domain-containing protein [Cohnella fermenti]